VDEERISDAVRSATDIILLILNFIPFVNLFLTPLFSKQKTK